MILRRMLISCTVLTVLVLTLRVDARTADEIRDQVNKGRVSIISGNVTEYLDQNKAASLGTDLTRVLDEEGELRVVNIMGRGPVETIEDILYLRGIDMGFVKADMLTYLDRHNMLPIAQQKIHYIAKLYDETFHILARRDISSIADLADKPVSAGLAKGDSYVSAETVFHMLDVAPKWVYLDWQTSLARLASGELAAIVMVAPKPSSLLQEVANSSDLHFLPLPESVELLNIYETGRLTSADYPKLVPEGQSVVTLEVGVLLAVYDWRPTQQRYGNISQFVSRFFDNFDELNWQQADLEANAPSWKRFEPAQDLVAARIAERQRENEVVELRTAASELETQFETFLEFFEQSQQGSGEGESDELEMLFSRFLEWQQQQVQE